jgi:hypothetical protein
MIIGIISRLNKKQLLLARGVGIATDYGLDNWVQFSAGTFLFSAEPRQVLTLTQPPIKWVSGALSPGVKRQGRKTDHSYLVLRSRMVDP